MHYFTLRVGAETPEQADTLNNKLERHNISLETFCNNELNIISNAVTPLEVAIELDRKKTIEDVIKNVHQHLNDFDIGFIFYVAAGYTTSEIYGCLTYNGDSFKKVEIPAPETLELFELCLRDIYLHQGEDKPTARSLAESDSGDYLNEFRDFLQERFSIESLIGKTNRVEELAIALSDEINSESDTASITILTMKPFVLEFLAKNELLN